MKKLIIFLLALPLLSFGQRISDLTAADTTGTGDIFVLVQGGTTKKITYDSLGFYLNKNSSYWTKTGNNIENNNTGKVIIPGDSTFFDVMPDVGTKVGRILHVNQYKEIEYISPTDLGDRIDSGRAASPTAYTTWVRDDVNNELEVANEYDQVVLTWADSIMYTANNTGTNYTIAHAYDAFKFTADKDYPLGTLGPIDIYVKKDGSITNVTGSLWKYIYSDNAGVPGTALSAISEPEMYGHIQTSYAAYPSQNGSPALVSGTPYWIVVQRVGVPTGGNVYVDCSNAGTALAAYSADGLSWTPVNNYTVKYRIHWQGESSLSITASHHFGIDTYSETEYGIQATSVYDPGVRGISTNAEGVQGNSTYGTGVQGNSTHNVGTTGISTNNTGVYGVSTNYYGVIGTTALTGMSGVWGQGTVSGARGGFFQSVDSYGVVGGSGTGIGVYGYSEDSFPIYGYGFPAGVTDTTSEIVKLEVGTNGTPAAGFGASIGFYNETTSGAGTRIAGIGSFTQNPSFSAGAGGLAFYTTNAITGYREVALMDSSGYLGIGTKTPSYMLTVNGEGYFESDLWVNDTARFIGSGNILTSGNGNLNINTGSGGLTLTGGMASDLDMNSYNIDAADTISAIHIEEQTPYQGFFYFEATGDDTICGASPGVAAGTFTNPCEWEQLKLSTPAPLGLTDLDSDGFAVDANDTVTFTGGSNCAVRFDCNIVFYLGAEKSYEFRILNVTSNTPLKTSAIIAGNASSRAVTANILAFDADADLNDEYIIQARDIDTFGAVELLSVALHVQVIHY